jgi:hypothetical protein
VRKNTHPYDLKTDSRGTYSQMAGKKKKVKKVNMVDVLPIQE